MNIRIWSGILPCMDISALNTTNDIEKLRAMALTMVQKVMSENAEKERELLEKSRRIQLLEEMLKLVRQQRFGKNVKRWLVCNAPCSKRMLMSISPRLPHIWINCSRNPLKKTKKRPVHARYANPYRLIFHGWKNYPAGH